MFTTILRDILKLSLPTERLQSYLPFQTRLAKGDNFVHIVNASVYAPETQFHTIYENSTLCARRSYTLKATKDTEPNCPGCIAHAKGIVTRQLYDELNQSSR